MKDIRKYFELKMNELNDTIDKMEMISIKQLKVKLELNNLNKDSIELENELKSFFNRKIENEN